MQLIKLLPDYYDDNVTMQALQETISTETYDLELALERTISECFVSTASDTLTRREKILGIEVDVQKSDAYRRERIRAKTSGIGTSTKEMIEEVASRYSNGQVEVVEDNENYGFLVRFVGILGIPGNMEGLKLTIEEIKPAHLEVEYEYIYNTWGDVSVITWGQAAAYTWEQIRTVNLNEFNG